MIKSLVKTEADALREVDLALDGLDDGARRRVLDWAEAKYGGKPSDGKPRLGRSEQMDPASSNAPPKDIKAFLTLKKPDSNYERVACLAYFLEKSGGASEMKTADITKANTDARLPKMTNPALFVRHATRTYGYLTSVGHGKVALSTRGEALVDALPNREQVKQALDDNPFKIRGKMKGKKSKGND